MKQGNYARHAAIWDWGGVDRTHEFKYWKMEAQAYGSKVLSLMAAIGETGAYLAEAGLSVTALDMTPEMIDEGRRRFDHLENLEFIQADALNFELAEKQYDYAFIGSTDLHHLQSLEQVKQVLCNIAVHLRQNGGLGLELWYPSTNSWTSPRQRFEPQHQVYKQQVWKEGSTSYDVISKQVKIKQLVFIKDGENLERFSHELTMQLYEREDVVEVLKMCGFRVIQEYGDFQRNPWSPKSQRWLIAAIKE